MPEDCKLKANLHTNTISPLRWRSGNAKPGKNKIIDDGFNCSVESSNKEASNPEKHRQGSSIKMNVHTPTF